MQRSCLLMSMLISILMLTACMQQPATPLRVGGNQWLGYQSLYLARDLGFYQQTPIRLVELTSATETLRAFRQGQLDVAAVTLDEALRLAENDDDLRIILVMDISNGADKILAKPEIEHASDLKGRCIAHEESALGAFMLYEFEQYAGLSHADIHTLPATIDQHLAVMADGECDAVISFDPMAIKLQQQGYKVIFDSSQIGGEIVDVLISRADILNSQRESLDVLVSGHFLAIDYLNQHPTEALKRIAPRMRLSVDELQHSIQQLILPDREQNLQLIQQLQLHTLHELSRIMLSAGLLQRRPDLQRLLDISLIDQNG